MSEYVLFAVTQRGDEARVRGRGERGDMEDDAARIARASGIDGAISVWVEGPDGG